MSVGFRVARERVTFCSVRMLTICADMVSKEPTRSASIRGEPTLTAITMSALQRSRASAIGTLSTRPPSTSLRPSSVIGDSRPGTDMLARIAEVRLPSRRTTRWPVPMSVAMIDSGSGNFSMTRSSLPAPTRRLKNSLILTPSTTPGGNLTPSLVTPISEAGMKLRMTCLWR